VSRKDDTDELAELKQQISQKMIILAQHISDVSPWPCP